MLETDAGSRRHLIFIVGFLTLLFGGFALWGAVEKAVQRGSFAGLSIGDPVPVEPDRAAFLAERRKWFLTRKQMAAHGKTGEWRKAVRVADTYLARQDDPSIRILRGEALFRLSEAEGGAEIAKVLRADDVNSSDAEADLFRGDNRSYLRETEVALKNMDQAKASPLDANNTAWLTAFTPTITDPELLAKAVSLSEKAVNAARSGDAPEVSGELATYTNTLGGVYYRSGRDKEAIATLLESEKLRTDPFNAAFLTLAYHRSGDETSAQVWQERLRKHLANTYATRDGQQYRHQLLLLWREIENVTQESPPVETNE
jgi:tetratricopeptide (TPR) repeat protein